MGAGTCPDHCEEEVEAAAALLSKKSHLRQTSGMSTILYHSFWLTPMEFWNDSICSAPAELVRVHSAGFWRIGFGVLRWLHDDVSPK